MACPQGVGKGKEPGWGGRGEVSQGEGAAPRYREASREAARSDGDVP